MSANSPFRRLFVGWRKVDWAEVYYEAPNKPDKGRVPALTLYESLQAKTTLRNPLVSEINWLPHFDPNNFEAGTSGDKRLLQQWFVYRCWEHMQATEDKVAQVRKNNQFAVVGNKRWQTWVLHADRGRASIRDNGEATKNQKDHDDGYESDGEGVEENELEADPLDSISATLPDPSKGHRSTAGRKRKITKNGPKKPNKIPKRSKKNPRNEAVPPPVGYGMSGVLPTSPLDGIIGGSTRGRADEDDASVSDAASEPFDPAPPETHPFTSPSTLGHSRSSIGLHTPRATQDWLSKMRFSRPSAAPGPLGDCGSSRHGSMFVGQQSDTDKDNDDDDEKEAFIRKFRQSNIHPTVENDEGEYHANDANAKGQRNLSDEEVQFHNDGLDDDQALQRAIKASEQPEARPSRGNLYEDNDMDEDEDEDGDEGVDENDMDEGLV